VGDIGDWLYYSERFGRLPAGEYGGWIADSFIREDIGDHTGEMMYDK